MALLSVKNLTVDFCAGPVPARALSSFGYDLEAGKTLAVVGESGCGKTVHALAIMGLLDSPPAKITSGEIYFKGKDLLKEPADSLRALRGARVSMIFQDPMTSLNPVLTIGRQLTEAIAAHEPITKENARARAAGMLAKAGLPEPEKKLDCYPHQFSGGMRQRVMIAMALALNPDMLIADEPTTALDVTIQAQILALIKKLRDERGMSVVLITHNMGIVADIADDVIVVYAGRAMERAPVADIFRTPRHPYTKALLDSIPSTRANPEKLNSIPGQPPAPGSSASGCAFAPRCARAWDKCREQEPPEFSDAAGRAARCWLAEGTR